ncbi:hypothetical protein [Pseudomonas helleri]|uniref:hypothetical protein n=1 Tax=Pseudomonas helleri TaxID=1608996 RepID=UPI003FD14D8C
MRQSPKLAKLTLTLNVRVRWWFLAYLQGVSLTSIITGLEPDPAKLEFWIKRGLKIEVA